MKTIFLVGYMGCGKSSLGRALAEQLGCEFIDLDNYIEQQAQQTIPSLFETRGEEAFRLLERSCLAEMAGRQNVVVATGG
ncbi:MAG: AAA family ATPase, partial [Bacteroidales bacterium]|nr:AAA family ATPase [Bacteroidales bacterium]